METTNGHSKATPAKKSAKGKGAEPAEITAEAPKPAAAKTVGIFIPKIQTVQTEIAIDGISPLIVHAWSEKAKKMMRDKQMGVATKKKDFKVPEEDFKGSRYIDSEGRDCVPALAFKNAAVEAGVLADVFKTTLRKAFFVRGDLVPIICPEGPKMREDLVRVGMGTADLRYRAMYEKWSCRVPVEFNPNIISAEQLFNLFDLAGYSIGICEWRPEKDGQFGRFRVKLG